MRINVCIFLTATALLLCAPSPGSAAAVRISSVMYDALQANRTVTPTSERPAASEHAKTCTALSALPAGYTLANATDKANIAAAIAGTKYPFGARCVILSDGSALDSVTGGDCVVASPVTSATDFFAAGSSAAAGYGPKSCADVVLVTRAATTSDGAEAFVSSVATATVAERTTSVVGGTRLYATLDAISPSAPREGAAAADSAAGYTDCDEYAIGLPLGWTLAAGDDEARAVIAAKGYPWGGSCVVTSDGAGHDPLTSASCGSSLLISPGAGKYLCASAPANARILISMPMPEPSVTPTIAPSPTATGTPVASPSASLAPSPTANGTSTGGSGNGTANASVTPTPSAAPSATPTPTATPTATPAVNVTVDYGRANSVVFNGVVYATLDDMPFDNAGGTAAESCQVRAVKMPAGWTLAHVTSDVRAMVASAQRARAFGATCLVGKGGAGVYTATGHDCATGGATAARLLSFGDYHAVRYCPHRVLISRSAPTDGSTVKGSVTWTAEADVYATGVSVTYSGFKYAAIDAVPTAASSSGLDTMARCQRRAMRVPVGWQIAPATDATRAAIASLGVRQGFGTRCLVLADGTSVRVGTAAPCGPGALIAHGPYASPSRCDMRVLVYAPATRTAANAAFPTGSSEICFSAQAQRNGTSATPDYATITVPSGTIRSLTLRRTSGSLKCTADSRDTYWGCDSATAATFGVALTNAARTVVFPGDAAGQSTLRGGSQIVLPGGGCDPAQREVVMKWPEATGYSLPDTASLQVHFVEALARLNDENNSGKVCFTAHAEYVTEQQATAQGNAPVRVAKYGGGSCSATGTMPNEIASVSSSVGTAAVTGGARVGVTPGFVGASMDFPVGNPAGSVVIDPPAGDPTFLGFSHTEPFGASAWIRFPSASERMMTIVGRMDTGPGGTRGWLFTLRGKSLEVSLRNAATPNAKRLAHVATGASAASRLQPGRWVHVGFAYSGSTKASGIAIYINGERADGDAEYVYDSLTADTPIVAAEGVKATIGGRGEGSAASLMMQGSIDEVSIWRGALTDDYLRSEYANTLAAYEPAICTGGAVVTASTHVGCADMTREALNSTTEYVDIAACSAGFAVRGVASVAGNASAAAGDKTTCGRAAGNDGPMGAEGTAGFPCAAEDACAAGWHVCRDGADVTARGGVAACTAVASQQPAMFFATGQRAGDTGATCSVTTGRNGVYGCGRGAAVSTCGPLTAVCGVAESASCPGSWSFGPNARMESASVFNTGPSGGGVMCCRDTVTAPAAASATPTPSATPVANATATPSATATPTPTPTATPAASNGSSNATSSNATTRSSSPVAWEVRQSNSTTDNSTATPTPAPNATASATPTPSVAPSATPTPSTNPSNPEQPTVTAVGSTSAVVSWTAFIPTPTGTVESYSIQPFKQSATGEMNAIQSPRVVTAASGITSTMVSSLLPGEVYAFRVEALLASGERRYSANSDPAYTIPETRCEYSCAPGSVGRCFFVVSVPTATTRDGLASICSARYGGKAAVVANAAAWSPANDLSFRGSAWVGSYAGSAAQECVSMSMNGAGPAPVTRNCTTNTLTSVVCEITSRCERDATVARGRGAVAVVPGSCRNGVQRSLVASSHAARNYTDAAAHCASDHGGKLASIVGGDAHVAASGLSTPSQPLWVAHWGTPGSGVTVQGIASITSDPSATGGGTCVALVNGEPTTAACTASLPAMCEVESLCGGAAAYDMRLNLAVSAFDATAVSARLGRQVSNMGLESDHVSLVGIKDGSVIMTVLASPPGKTASSVTGASTNPDAAEIDASLKALVSFSELTVPGSLLLNPSQVLSDNAITKANTLTGVGAVAPTNTTLTPAEGDAAFAGSITAGDPGIANAADVPTGTPTPVPSTTPATSGTAAPSTLPAADDGGGGGGGAAVAAGVIIALLAVVGGLVGFWCYKKKQKEKEDPAKQAQKAAESAREAAGAAGAAAGAAATNATNAATNAATGAWDSGRDRVEGLAGKARGSPQQQSPGGASSTTAGGKSPDAAKPGEVEPLQRRRRGSSDSSSYVSGDDVAIEVGEVQPFNAARGASNSPDRDFSSYSY